ncbi:2-phospho-L-lactate guanylyltransferase [Gammaproteobacteria bacterium]|nr:2-phospho-L-lactate guanylyltransferase [Gammaproteobacteria bacterium]
MQVSAFIPIKKYSQSKGRLASILSKQQRSDLSKAMAAQTIKALTHSNICDSITLVTNDPHLIIEGASTFFSESPLNQALNEAIACNDSNNPILIMHADLPRINERDLDNLVASFNKSFISIVPDIEESGTNCLLYDPAMKFNLQFGMNSYALFLREFKANDYRWNQHSIESLQYDLDSEDDYFKLKDYVRG